MDKDTNKLALAYSSKVSVSRRVMADMYIGNRQFDTVSSIVEAAFIDGRNSVIHGEPFRLSFEEIKILYNLLSHQYISYENPEAIALVKKLGSIVDKADR